MAHYRGFARFTGPSGWLELDGKQLPITAWEIVTERSDFGGNKPRGWFRCTSRELDAHQGDGIHLHLRNWDLKDQDMDVVIARVRAGGGVCEFSSVIADQSEPGRHAGHA